MTRAKERFGLTVTGKAVHPKTPIRAACEPAFREQRIFSNQALAQNMFGMGSTSNPLKLIQCSFLTMSQNIWWDVQDNLADTMTKPLGANLHQGICRRLNNRKPVEHRVTGLAVREG